MTLLYADYLTLDSWNTYLFLAFVAANMVKLSGINSVEYILGLLFLNIIIFFFKDYERSLRQLSLDDIERLAGRLLHPDGEGMDTSYMD